MRVYPLLNKVLGIKGTVVVSARVVEKGLVLGVRARSGRRHRCPCGKVVKGRYDTRSKRWRHLDFGTTKVFLEAVVARVRCPRCGRVRVEQVAWAREGSRFTRGFEDQVAWLAGRMDKTSTARLMRTSWATVDQIVTTVVNAQLEGAGGDRLEGLRRIGVDEISWRRGRKFLTVVADHDTGKVVWVADGHREQSLTKFFDALGPQRCSRIEAVTMDGSIAFRAAALKAVPDARLCLDPFHVIKWASEALDSVFRAHRFEFLRQAAQLAPTGTSRRASWVKARFALRRAREDLTTDDHKTLKAMRRERVEVHQAWLLKEELRDLYRTVPPAKAAAYLTTWIHNARTSGIPAMTNLATRVQRRHEAIVAAIELGISNSRLEGINAKIRLIQRRGYGYHRPESLTAAIYLSNGIATINLPTRS